VNFEIGQILQLKAEIRNLKLDWNGPRMRRLAAQAVQFEISDFGFELQDLSNFKISPADPLAPLPFAPSSLYSLSFQDWDAVDVRRGRYALQVSVYVRDFLVGHYFGCIRRHLVSGLSQLFHECRKGYRAGSQSWTVAALTEGVMALKAPSLHEKLLSVLGVAGGRSLGWPGSGVRGRRGRGLSI
jgi:hypothetical protein